MPSLVEIVDRSENGERGGDDHDHVHEDAEGVGADQIAVGHAHVVRRDADAGERGERADEAEPAEHALAGRADERVDDHDQHAEGAEHDFREEAVKIGDLLGGEMHYCRTCLPAGAATAAAALVTLTRRITACGLGQQMTGERRSDASRGPLVCSMHVVDRGGHAPREERGSDAHEENGDGHGDENHALAAGRVRQRLVFLDGDFAESHALVSPQQVIAESTAPLAAQEAH